MNRRSAAAKASPSLSDRRQLLEARCRAILEDPHGAVEAARAANPMLCWEGFLLVRHARETNAAHAARLERSRQGMTDEDALGQFRRAVKFLLAHSWAVRPTPYRRFNSYGWKHVAERWAGEYVSNGMFLAACHAAGLTVVPVGPGNPNGFVNLSQWLRDDNFHIPPATQLRHIRRAVEATAQA